jgi:hypothetical protein
MEVVAQTIVSAMSRSLLKSRYFALQKCIALGFWMAIGSRNSPKRTIFDVWCSEPSLPLYREEILADARRSLNHFCLYIGTPYRCSSSFVN